LTSNRIAYANVDIPHEDNVDNVRKLFENKNFSELSAILEKYQTLCEKDIKWELHILDLYKVFANTNPSTKVLLDEWVQGTPRGWPPLLARATYYEYMGWKARGTKSANEISEEQFKRMTDNFQMSIQDIKPALDINPKLFQAYDILMNINITSGNQERGNMIAQKGLNIYPDSFIIRFRLAYLFLPRWGGSHEAMEKLAKEATIYAEKNPNIKLLQSMVLWDQASMAGINNDSKKAIELGEKALNYGETWNTMFVLALSYRNIGSYDKSLNIIERIITLLPNLPDRSTGHTNRLIDSCGLRSEVLFLLGRYEDALRDIEKIERIEHFGELGVNTSSKFRNWGSSQLVSKGHELFKKDLSQAIEKYSLAVQFSPENSDAYCWRGIAYDRTGKVDSALVDLRKAISINPRLFDAYKGLDDFLIKQNRLDEIIESWTKFIQLESGNANAYYERSGTYYKKNDFISSYRDVKRACKFGNNNACNRLNRSKDLISKEDLIRIDSEIDAEVIGPSASVSIGNKNPIKVKTSKGKWSYRNPKGDILTAEEFEDAWDFNDGLARVKQNGKWGYLDLNGKLLIKPMYDYCWDFSGGKAKVRLEDGSTLYIDRTGKRIDE
jgi:tetratricopeptide (TPR) repeat protein